MGILIPLLILSLTALLYSYYKNKYLAKTISILTKKNDNLESVLERNIQQANQITLGNYLSENNIDFEDQLSVALHEMGKSLMTADIEDNKRNWSMTGMTKLAEIIRLSNHDIEELSNSLITFLIKYLGANQGGVFVLVNDQVNPAYLELKSCYAYERKKYINKKILLEEGILGQSVLENDTVYLTDIPNDYVNISSGLGTANPKNIIIIPLKSDGHPVGALEIASFKIIEPHEREFLEKASESIAASILTTRISDHTNKLLKESQELAEQLKQQEEEVRQNMEEMQATQEEMIRKESEINRLLEQSKRNEQQLQIQIEQNLKLEIDNKKKSEQMLAEIELNRKIMTQVINKLPQKIFLKDENGRFLLLNESVAGDLKKTPEELIGKNDFDLFPLEDAERFWKAEKEEVLDSLKRISAYEDFEVEGHRKFFYTVKMPFKFPGSDRYGILGYQSDITELKNLENKIIATENNVQQRIAELQSELELKNKLINELKTNK